MHHSSAMVSKKFASHKIKFMEFYKINIENFKFLLEFGSPIIEQKDTH